MLVPFEVSSLQPMCHHESGGATTAGLGRAAVAAVTLDFGLSHFGHAGWASSDESSASCCPQ